MRVTGYSQSSLGYNFLSEFLSNFYSLFVSSNWDQVVIINSDFPFVNDTSA